MFDAELLHDAVLGCVLRCLLTTSCPQLLNAMQTPAGKSAALERAIQGFQLQLPQLQRGQHRQAG